MPWPVYTERLLATAVPRTWVTATVPAGKRAIIKSVAAINSSTGAMVAHVTTVSNYVVALSVPDLYNTHAVDLLAVAYGGEEIRGYIDAQSGFLLVTGWLLDDPSGARASPLAKGVDLQLAEPGSNPAPLPGVLDAEPDA